MPFNLGGPELIIILIIVLVVFGAGKLPNVMRDLGTGVREFKKAQTEADGAPHAAPASMSTTTTPATPDQTTAHTEPAGRPVESGARV